MGGPTMIGSLEGKITWKSENMIIIEVSGVGYLVETIELSSLPNIGQKVQLYIYTYVREDAIDLYGFPTMEERQLFKILLSVSRIGPKAATNILSNLSYKNFINAIMTENIPILKQIKGIGPKTAQRLILELKSKLDNLAQEYQLSDESSDSEELFEALSNLGYSRKEVRDALSEVDIPERDQLEDKIRKLLSYLGRESL
jgi:Holliday junction DNA helicase RuvA